MGGFFGVASKQDCIADVFFGTDYHSHLGTRRAGIAVYDPASSSAAGEFQTPDRYSLLLRTRLA